MLNSLIVRMGTGFVHWKVYSVVSAEDMLKPRYLFLKDLGKLELKLLVARNGEIAH